MPLKRINPGSVALMIPCGGGVEPRVVQSALNLATMTAFKGHLISQVGVTDRTVIHTARNALATDFLKTDCEWSFWMDSDMILENRHIDVSLAWAEKLKAKMLTGIYFQRLGEHKPVLWKSEARFADGTTKPRPDAKYTQLHVYPKSLSGAPFVVDTAGFGCVLIHREVFEAMKMPYFKWDFYEENGRQMEASEDFYFFKQASNLGFKLYAIPELKCGHVGTAPIITHKDMKFDENEMKELDLTEAA